MFIFLNSYSLSESLITVMSPPASDSSRSKKKRLKQKMEVPSQILREKEKLNNQKKITNQMTRRIGDRDYDQMMLAKNKERVKRCREKKKLALANKENFPPSELDESMSTITENNSYSNNQSSSYSNNLSSSSSNNQSSSSSNNHSYSSSQSSISPIPVPQVLSGSTFVETSASPFPNTNSSSPTFLSPATLHSACPSVSLSSTPISHARSRSSPTGDSPALMRLPGFKSRQQLAGEKRRRETLRDKNTSIDEMENEVKILKTENTQLEDDNMTLVVENCELKRTVEKLEADKKDQYIWFKMMWEFCSSDTKKDIKTAVHAAKDEFPKGVIKGLRDNAGINFSNPQAVSHQTRVTGDIKQKIIDFAVKNSFEVPDKKQAKKKVRYMRHFKVVLHQQFLMENPDLECHYTTFCSHFPPNIMKPGINSHGSCLCEDCENFSLKLEALKRAKLLAEVSLDKIIRSSREGNSQPEEDFLSDLSDIKKCDQKDSVVSYFIWEDDKQEVRGENGVTTTKKMTRRNYQVTVSTLIDRTTEAFEPLKQHLHRDHVIKNFIREVRMKALADSSKVCLTVDWSENGTLIIPGEVQTAFFGRATYSIHSGYMYQKDNNHGFAMITDENNHKAESIWAALTPMLEELVEQGVKEIYICSDSTGAQYRNCKNAFLMKNFALQHKVVLSWIFTEKHHGKSPADGIGGNIKNQVEQLTSFSTEHNIRNAADVKALLTSTNTSIKITHFTREEIQETLDIIPGELNSLRGATKYHLLSVNAAGGMSAKELPTDDQSIAVNITVKRKRHQTGTGIEAPIAAVDN